MIPYITNYFIIRFIIAFIFGFIIPLIANIAISFVYFLLIMIPTYLILSIFSGLFTVGLSPTIDQLLINNGLFFGYLISPSINSLLYGYSHQSSKIKFWLLFTQMMITYLCTFNLIISPCNETTCYTLDLQPLHLELYEQTFLFSALVVLSVTYISIGSYIATYNPLKLAWEKLFFYFKFSKIETESHPSYTFNEYRKPLFISGLWLPIYLSIVLYGFFTIQVSWSKWDVENKPFKQLNIYISEFSHSKALYKSIYREYAVDSLCQWEKASNHLFHFKLVNKRKDSDISVDWIPYEKYNLIDLAHLGLTESNPNEHNEFMKDAIITVKSQNVPDNAIKKILLHEFGHSLGLDHSKNKKDIMYRDLLSTDSEKSKILSEKEQSFSLQSGDLNLLLEKYPSIKNRAQHLNISSEVCIKN